MAALFARRHYQAMARVLRDFREGGTWDERTLDALEAEMARMFTADNPRFVADTFRRAAAPLVMAEPRCDVCNIHAEETPDWCGECGNCAAHCAGYVGCPERKAS